MISWLSSPITSVIIAIAGIVIGTTIAFIFYYKSKAIAKPRYLINNYNLIGLETTSNLPHQVSVLYEDKQIAVLNKTIVQFLILVKKPLILQI
ncbi:MAG TPA: hypothetical protein PKU80_03830 [Candidatus Limiplasma sp.]|nr:hypothetical protein [Candidatus Limiplasma sp.]